MCGTLVATPTEGVGEMGISLAPHGWQKRVVVFDYCSHVYFSIWPYASRGSVVHATAAPTAKAGTVACIDAIAPLKHSAEFFDLG